MDPEVVERQKAQIRRWQSMGAEVLMSAHVRVDLSEDQALALALEIQSRGADIVKIVTSCQSKEQALTILQTNMRLAKDLEKPFIYTCQGPYGRLIRPCAPLFGTMLVFGHGAYHPLANPEKPLLANLQDFYAKYAI